MSAGKLAWHGAGEREIESGVNEVALYPMSGGSYSDGVAWNGVTAITENPGGADLTNLYADNMKYASLRAAETFACTIEAYTYPPEWAECDGSAQAVTGVYVGQQPRKAFGLVYKTRVGDETHPGMDKGYKLHIIYNCTASPSSRSYTTINDNPDAISFSWEASSTPTPVTGTSFKDVSTIVIDTTKLTNGTSNSNLVALEKILYGANATTDPSAAATAPTLASPATVLSTMGWTAA